MAIRLTTMTDMHISTVVHTAERWLACPFFLPSVHTSGMFSHNDISLVKKIMNMNLPVLTSIVKKPRAKIKPSPIFSLSWVNFKLLRMGKGKTNTKDHCQT